MKETASGIKGLMKSYHYGNASRKKNSSSYKAENVWQHRQKPQ
jgi:hypothetical protein